MTEKSLLKQPVICSLIFISFASIFLFFNSNTYTAVDGGLRCLDVFYKHKPSFGLHGHMLSQVHVYYFHKILGIFNVIAKDAFEYFRYSTILNALAGAASLSLLYLLSFRLTSSICFSLLSVFLTGFSSCFLINATNPDEPMVGFLLSIIAIAFSLLSLSKNNKIYSFISGLCLSYATATYQSMLLISPALLFIYLHFIFTAKKEAKREYIKLILLFLLALFAGFVFIYGIYYHIFFDITSFQGMLKKFFELDTVMPDAYGSIDPLNFIRIGFGMVKSFFMLPFDSIRQTFLEPKNYIDQIFWLVPFVLTGCILIVTFYCLIRIVKNKKGILLFLCSMALFFIFPSFLPLWLAPDYSKFWLHPITVLNIFIAYCVSNFIKQRADPKTKRIIVAFFTIFVAILILWNANTVLIPNHKGEGELVKAASVVADITGENSLVFTGWSRFGVIFSGFFRYTRTCFSIDTAKQHLDEKHLIEEIDKKIADAKRHGQNVYFLGFLDEPRAQWDIRFTFRHKGSISYESFQKYRNNATEIKNFRIYGNEYKLFKIK